MTKGEYISILEKKLNHLPRAEYDKAMEYFREYFEEAGEENEQQAIQDLGDPAMAGEQIILDLAIKNSNEEEKPKTVKSGMSAVWIGILALFAGPIALPVAVAILAVCAALVVAIVATLSAFAVSGIALIVSVVFVLIGGVTVITQSFPVFLSCIGYAVAAAGVGIAVVYSSYLLLVKFICGLIGLFGKVAKRGEKKDDK